MSTAPYQFRWMPKLIMTGSWEFDVHWKGATIVDDPDVLRKTASSPVVAEWGDIAPIKGASLIHLIALGAREVTGPNRNGDGFKIAFLKVHHPTFKKYGALYRDHINKDYTKRDGDVIKTAYNDDMGRTELLVAADHEKCADWLPKVERGDRVDFSMGFDCKYDVCEICHNKAATRKNYCDCIKKLGMGKILPDGRKVCVDNPEGVFNDISKVATGADMIAQHLRKVAGLDPFMSEFLGGAEFAESIGLKSGSVSAKQALVEKMSRMEKQVPVSAFKLEPDTKVSKKCANILRDLRPEDMFGHLAKLGVVLDLTAFARLIMGDDFATIEPYVKEASMRTRSMFTDLLARPDHMGAVCANDTYEPNMKAAGHLGFADQLDLVQNFSIEPEFARERLLKQALVGSKIQLAQTATLSDPARSLLDEYAAYKLAILASLERPESSDAHDELCLFAVMSS